MKRFIKWDFFKYEVPIKEVCDILGLVEGKHNEYHSPFRVDRHPSLTIETNENSRYFNTWKDWVENEGGGPIELVIATKFNILPNTYWKNKDIYKDELNKAIEFLDSYFPGGIIYREEDRVLNKLQLPMIPKNILTAIGEKYNPLSSYYETTDSYADRAEMLLDKMQKYENNLLNYGKRILSDFPELDVEAQKIIVKKVIKHKDMMHEYTEKVQDFYFKACEEEYPEIDFVEEEKNLYKEKSVSKDEIDLEIGE